MTKIKTTKTAIITVILVLGISSWFVFDLLFAKPEIHDGIIVKMEVIEGKAQSSQYRMGSRSRPQLISGKAHDRWIATVRMTNGDTVLVECNRTHFDNKEIGGTLRFKEFTGGSLEIKYFAHSEEQ